MSEKQYEFDEEAEDFYDRYHNWPDDPAMVDVPGSAAWTKKQKQQSSRGGNGNVKDVLPDQDDVDGNR